MSNTIRGMGVQDRLCKSTVRGSQAQQHQHMLDAHFGGQDTVEGNGNYWRAPDLVTKEEALGFELSAQYWQKVYKEADKLIDKGVAPSVVLKLVLVTAQHQQEKKLEGHRELMKKLHGQAEAVKQHNTDRDSCLLNELKALRKATKKSSLSEILSSVHKLFGVKK